jgi:hypothetical protein
MVTVAVLEQLPALPVTVSVVVAPSVGVMVAAVCPPLQEYVTAPDAVMVAVPPAHIEVGAVTDNDWAP